jgi:mevalonate kinase
MTYPGKLLLFGEYTAVRGAQSLAVPLDIYRGKWDFARDKISIPYPLEGYIHFLEKQDLGSHLHLSRFKEEVQEGLYFDSNIPVGYGAGSSGALCAGIYERFAFAPIDQSDTPHYPELKAILARLEGYFHGSSSGTDPLICYLRKPTLLLPNGLIKTVGLQPAPSSSGTFFLIDTGQSRQTAPLVKLFLKKCEQTEYAQALNDELIPYNDQAISNFLKNKREALMGSFEHISRFQLKAFLEMIPESYRTIWQEGLETEQYAIKLCGAGGGGFLLGYTLGKLEDLPIDNTIPLDL